MGDPAAKHQTGLHSSHWALLNCRGICAFWRLRVILLARDLLVLVMYRQTTMQTKPDTQTEFKEHLECWAGNESRAFSLQKVFLVMK